MRDMNFDRARFVSELEKNLTYVPKRVKDLRRSVVDNPNFPREKNFFLKVYLRDLDSLIVLGIALWWLPKELQVLVRLELEQKLKRFSSEDQGLISQFLVSKQRTVLFLLETNLYHTRDFFGNILKEVPRVLDSLKILKEKPKKIVYPQRKRGYHDHGSRVLDHRWLPKSDWSLTKEQNELEQTRIALEDTLAFIEGFIT